MHAAMKEKNYKFRLAAVFLALVIIVGAASAWLAPRQQSPEDWEALEGEIQRAILKEEQRWVNVEASGGIVVGEIDNSLREYGHSFFTADNVRIGTDRALYAP